eukprot:scaffold2767_cov177-Amphora_coffeaeformis.AAC.25
MAFFPSGSKTKRTLTKTEKTRTTQNPHYIITVNIVRVNPHTPQRPKTNKQKRTRDKRPLSLVPYRTLPLDPWTGRPSIKPLLCWADKRCCIEGQQTGHRTQNYSIGPGEESDLKTR